MHSSGEPQDTTFEGIMVDPPSPHPPSPPKVMKLMRSSSQAPSTRDCSIASSSFALPTSHHHAGEMCGASCGSLLQYLPLYATLCEEFGESAVLSITTVYLLVKGITVTMVQASALPFLKDVFDADTSLYQRLLLVGTSAWALKPLLGVWSDNVPLFGYHKRGYLLIASIMAIVLTVCMILLPGMPSLAIVFGLLLFCTNLSFATLDLLTEGTYTALMSERPQTGSMFVSWVWGCAMVGSTIASTIEGPLADAGHPRWALVVCLPLFLIVLFPISRNWVCEIAVPRRRNWCPTAHDIQQLYRKLKIALSTSGTIRTTGCDLFGPAHHGDEQEGTVARDCDDDDNTANFADSPSPVRSEVHLRHSHHDSASEEPSGGELHHNYSHTGTHLHQRSHGVSTDSLRISFYGALVAVGALVLATSAIVGVAKGTRLFITLATATVLGSASFLFLPKAAAQANLFFFLKEALYVQIPGALDFYYTAPEKCVADAPHFSYTYYQTFTAIVGSLAGLLGVMLFQRYLSSRPLRVVFWVTTLLKIAASLVDVFIILRWNKTYLGLSDKMTYFLGDAIVFNVCYMLDFVPATVLITKMCPAGLESTMFALLAGFSNFGQAVSQSIGSFLMDYFEIEAMENKQCDFEFLPQLVMTAHALLPLLVIPCSILLIDSRWTATTAPQRILASSASPSPSQTRADTTAAEGKGEGVEEQEEEGANDESQELIGRGDGSDDANEEGRHQLPAAGIVGKGDDDDDGVRSESTKKSSSRPEARTPTGEARKGTPTSES